MLLSIAPWLMEKAGTICPSTQSQEDQALGENFCLELPESCPHPSPLPSAVLWDEKWASAACQRWAPSHAWTIAHLGYGGWSQFFLSYWWISSNWGPLTCQWAAHYWECMSLGEIHRMQAEKVLCLSSTQRVVWKCARSCNGWPTGRGSPADTVTLDFCLWNWKFMVEFFSLLKHKGSYFFCST